MNRVVKLIIALTITSLLAMILCGCSATYSPNAQSTQEDVSNTLDVGSKLASKQPTPTDISYSLERYNLIRRAYWVNGMRDKANTVPCPIADIPMGYVILLTEGGGVVGRFEVDGKVSSLNSFLTPDSEYFEVIYGGDWTKYNKWIADVDGSYGENDSGIFFFTPDGKYMEWNGTYLFSDIPFEIGNPVITYQGS